MKRKREVAHKQLYRPGVLGGTVNTTLCGRVQQGEDMNVGKRVTCKLCLRLIERQPKKTRKA